jgi:alcohol dehydrogenase (cytochrome c)
VAVRAQVRAEDIAKAPDANWLSYSGDYSGRRFSGLRQIDIGNAKQVVPKWIFHVPQSHHLETTPLVLDGIMYVTNSNEIWGLDAQSGRSIWHYKYTATKVNNPNRGAAILGNRVFFVSSDAHLIALHRQTGAVLWNRAFADHEKGYSSTLAPLATRDKVIVGVSGGECGIRGYVDAFDADTGKHAWRFWTIPGPGEPGSETWSGHPADYSGGSTWMTGTYEPSTNTLFWTSGNPGPDFYGGARAGDNLYSNSVVALDADTGERKWHFQFTPHDTHDWDAEEIPVLIDGPFQGAPRKLLAQANRNGFFYVLDRANGRMLMAKSFVKKLTWARGVLPDGRPDLIPGMDPTPDGKMVCPGVIGATNWFSPSFNPDLGLFYVMSVERCDLYTSSARPYTKGQCYSGTGVDVASSESGQFILRAIDLQTGAIRWELPMASHAIPMEAMPGTLATAGGLVFFADDAGYFSAVNGRDGQTLWYFYTGQSISASPITYAVDGKQFVAIATATDIMAFGLFEPSAPGHQPPAQRAGNSPKTH